MSNGFAEILQNLRNKNIQEPEVVLPIINNQEEFNNFFITDNTPEEMQDFYNCYQDLEDNYKKRQVKRYQEEKLRQVSELNNKGSYTIYDCKKCNNNGTIPKLYWHNGDFTIYETVCNCYKLKKSLAEMKRNNLLPLLQKRKFNNFIVKEKFQANIKKIAENFLNSVLKGKNKSFFIGGQTGCGKTHICCAILNELVKKGIFIKYFDYLNDIDKLKKLQFQDVELFQQTKEEYKTADFLYFDDFLYDTPSEADIKLLFDIINNRYNNDKPIIISSEKLLIEICNINGSIGGRIKEMTRDFNINIDKDISKNYRMRQAV
jgi:DNA replication protein DnaC